jgi:hypothetical protein
VDVRDEIFKPLHESNYDAHWAALGNQYALLALPAGSLRLRCGEVKTTQSIAAPAIFYWATGLIALKMPLVAVGLRQLGNLCCKNLAKTRGQIGSNREMVTAPFSRFFIPSTPNCHLTGVVSLFDALSCPICTSTLEPTAMDEVNSRRNHYTNLVKSSQ